MLNKFAANADSLIFITENSYDAENPKFNEFIFNFRKEMNRNPKNLEISGYSLIEMLVNIQSEAPEKSVLKILSDFGEYNSVSGKVILKNKRSNSSSDIYRFSSKKGLFKVGYQENTRRDSLETSKIYFNTGYVNEVTCHYEKAVENYLLSLGEIKRTLSVPDSLFNAEAIVNKVKARLGNSYYMLKDFKNAGLYFNEVLKYSPEDKDIIFKNAVAGSSENPKNSLEILNGFINDKNYSSEALFEIGNIYNALSDRSKALENYGKSAKLKNKKAVKMMKMLNNENTNNEKKNINNTKEKINFDW